jgi:plastocyanin
MRKLIIGLAASALLVSSAALAVKSGDTLYIKTKDAKLLDKPDAKGKTIGTMKPGDTVTWKEADKNKPFHKIEAAGKAGFTVQQNLTPNQPSKEVATSDGQPIDQEAFKSSGAATKALSEAGLKYGEGNTDLVALSKGIMTAEGIAAKVEMQEASDYVAKSTGGGK